MTDKQIFSPTSRSLRVVLAPLAPDADGRRLWLRQRSDSRGEVRDNELVLHVGDLETAQRLTRLACSETGMVARRGTRASYRQELRATRACLKTLGWTLSQEEERVLAPLEEYAHRLDPRSRIA
jgi:hypothetical protein